MGHPAFMYFLPGVATGVSFDVVRAAGLEHAFDSEAAFVQAGLVTGPGDQGGVIVAAGDPGTTVGYYPNAQTWCRLPGHKTAYLGHWNETPPTPARLRRRETLPGHEVKLGDGSVWTVPLARQLAEVGGELEPRCALPTSMSMNEDGEWMQGPPRERYARLWQIAAEWSDAMLDAHHEDTGEQQVTVSFPVTSTTDLAVEALAFNYRIGRGECAALGLFDVDGKTAYDVLNAVIDWPTLVEWMGKVRAGSERPAASDGTNTSSGAGGSVPATVPPLRTSSR